MASNINGVKIWDYVNFFGDPEIGEGTSIGCFCDIGGKIGKNCMIQCHVSIPPCVEIGNNVFVGPGVHFANEKVPFKSGLVKTIVKDGAIIGMGALIGAGLTIGKKAMIGMGAVVTKDVPAGETWIGSPAHKFDDMYEEKTL